MISLARPLHILDFETTGLDPATARIIQIGFQTYTEVFPGVGPTSTWQSLINPGIPIPPASTATHHITDGMMSGCRVCGRLEIEHPVEGVIHSINPVPPGLLACPEFKPIPKIEQIIERMAHGFSNCDFGGKNVRYDLRVMAAETARHRVIWTYDQACVIDADRLEQIGEPRTLSHLYEKHTGKKLEGAHDALVDVNATAEVITRQLETYDVLPRDLRQLHDLQWPGWIDSDGKFRFDEHGTPRCTFGKHRGVMMSAIPPSYYRWLTEADFPPDVKRIAGEAIAGRFPKRATVNNS